MRISEKKTVENPVLRFCKKRWPLMQCLKMNGMGQRSYPDRMFLWPGGGVCFIEFKSPGELPTDLQSKKIKELISLGFAVYIHDDPRAAIAALVVEVEGV